MLSLFGQRRARNIVTLAQIRTYAEVFREHGPELLDDQVPGETGERYEVDAELNNKVSLYCGDITRLKVDGIVRSTNKTLDSPDGISGFIVKEAGAGILEELATLRQCQPGKVVTTAGYLLPAKYIVHAVGGRSRQVLENCYKECFGRMLERENEIRSLAFCCISTGNGRFPNDGAAMVALRTIRWSLETLKRNGNLQRIDRIIFCVFKDTDLQLYIQRMQFFFPCQPVDQHGVSGSFAPPAYDPVDRKLQTIKGIDLTLGPCILTKEPDPDTVKAKMPCGHVIAPKSLAHYCKEEVKKGMSKFLCPVPDCQTEWPYPLVRHVACFTEDEASQVEDKLADNTVAQMKEFKRCPGCRTVCYRAPGVGNCVRCPSCSGSGRKYDFCWVCLRKWKRLTPLFSCGNSLCGERDKIKILANCKTKQIDFCDDCPALRGCPKCGQIVENSSNSGHVVCPYCPGGFDFCFICLTGKSDGKWKCWPYFGGCKLAPRQTHLPQTIG